MTRGTGQPSAILYVSNLGKTTTETDLKKTFDGCVEARIISNTQTGESTW